jgi:nitrite reductase/ring-hydroxylating ferredoxin subunit
VQGGRYTVLLEHCAHQGGPLGQGGDVDVEGEQCVVCPWHGSTFRLADGSVVHGPAASNQPALAVRVNGGRLEVRRP